MNAQEDHHILRLADNKTFVPGLQVNTMTAYTEQQQRLAEQERLIEQERQYYQYWVCFIFCRRSKGGDSL